MLSAEYKRRIVEKAFSQIADVYQRQLSSRGLTFDDVEYFHVWPLPDPVLGENAEIRFPSWRLMLYWQLKNGQTIRSFAVFWGTCPLGNESL